MAGRTYRYFEGKPLYAFGHGLSYTSFAFNNLRLDHSTINTGQSVIVSLDVTNSGERAGDEVVQLYVGHRDASGPRPIKELKGFQRISLQPGESRTVTFTLGVKELGYYNEALEFAMQPGTIEIMVGSSSANLPLSGSLEITA
jgi:beta-glucosidase